MGSATPTMTTKAHCPISEATRERETFKYDFLETKTAALDDPAPVPSLDLSASPDPGLTAFAQLGLYRLNACHSVISLFDRSHQHIVADAVRPGPEVAQSICGNAIPRSVSICEHVLTGPVRRTATSGQHSPEDLPVSIVHNLEAHPQFCSLADARYKFYAAVPIRSPEDINIGVYCVFDTKPRPDGLTAEEQRFLQDISPTVMDYLEFKRANKWCKREGRKVWGLGNFVQGKATLSPSSGMSRRASLHDIPEVGEGALNKSLQALHVHDSQGQAGADEIVEREVWKPRQGPNGVSVRRIATGPPAIPQARKAAPRLSPADILKGEVERVFSKAANIIRESIQVEGALFLDASIHSFGGLVGGDPKSAISESLGIPDESDGDEAIPNQFGFAQDPTCKVLGFSTSQSSSINGDGPPIDHTCLPERYLQTLLQKYPNGHIINFEEDGTPPDHSSSEADDTPPSSPLAQRTSTVNGDDWTWKGADPKRTHSARSAASSLIKIFPGARSVAIVPLWDPQRSRWFAGGFVWTKTPARIFTVESELSYLKVFGLAAMAEVSRLNAKASIKTETGILGSISHELRSPLHGVVGAAELLRDTALDGFQQGIVNTIETSGRTLLDTIDHLLDYSQTSNILRASHTEQRASSVAGPRTRASSSASLPQSVPELPVQLDLLVEEVVESVMAGHAFRALSDSRFTALDPPRRPSNPPRAKTAPGSGHVQRADGWFFSPGAVQIYLDIDPSASWAFRTHPGAFRRVVMNLFGNSLKFTSAGSITVSLRQQQQKPPAVHDGTAAADDDDDAIVVLTVSDTGRGINESYLRDHLFTPFSQEDNFSPGTGLGLSLVRQMATVLGGTVDVFSRVGKGTTVTVSLPLPRGGGGGDHHDGIVDGGVGAEEAAFREDVRALAGRTVLLRGFEAGAGRKQHLRLVEGICRDWLGMQVVLSGAVPHASPDFIICTEGGEGVGERNDLTAARVENVEDEPDLLASCPHIFICLGSTMAHDMLRPNQVRLRKSFEFLSQPVGPRKLAQALLSSQSRWRESRASSADSAGSEPSSSEYIAEPATPLQNGDEMGASHVAEFPGDPKLESTSGTKLVPVVVETALPSADGDFEVPDSPPQDGQTRGAAVVVPARQQPALARPVTPAVEAQASILIVDDNAINLKILAAYMTKLKQPHTSATNGLEAVERYTQSPHKYSCILTDISMPVMDGLESTRRIRAFESARRLRPAVVIALTGLGGADVRRDAFASGVDLLLTRPLVLKGLVGALEATGLR